MKKTDKKWIMLCSTAVAAVYAAGYFTTEPQVALGQQPIHQQVVKQVAQPNSSASSKDVVVASTQGKSSSQAQAQNTPPIPVQPKRIYKEGTFTGQGMNRRGYIDVQVNIKNDKITDVQISNFRMHYSERDVVGLPNEVVQKQSAQVDNVSGATYSTAAFSDAVQQALNQAKNA